MIPPVLSLTSSPPLCARAGEGETQEREREGEGGGRRGRGREREEGGGEGEREGAQPRWQLPEIPDRARF
jgi:hypothetical protein